jgi:hypothetical protein
MWDQLRRFSALERPARSLFLRASALLPLVSLALRWKGFRGTQQALRRFLPGPSVKPDSSSNTTIDRERAALTARMVHAAVRHSPAHASCLEESLTLWWLLGRQAISSELRIGVRKNGQKLEAHAWVERDGAALSDSQIPHQHYAAFEEEFSSLPPAAP